MVAIFDPSIFYKGAQLQQQARQPLNDAFSNIMAMYNQQQQLKAAGLKEQKKQATDPDYIFAQLQQGLPVTQDQLALAEVEAMKRSGIVTDALGQRQMMESPLMGLVRGGQGRQSGVADTLFPMPQGEVAPPTMGAPQVGGMSFPDVAGDGVYNIAEADMLPPVAGSDMIDPTMLVQTLQTPIQQSGIEREAQGLMEESGVKGTPVGRKMLMESGIRLNEKRLEKEIDFAKEQMKTDKGKNQIVTKIKDLQRINEELKKEGALQTEEGGFQNILVGATGTGIGGVAESALSPKAKRLREDYKNVVGGIIPYYIAANNLPATVVDTEEFAQRIINAFGNPSGFAETNIGALDRALKEFGYQEQEKQDLGSDPLGLFK